MIHQSVTDFCLVNFSYFNIPKPFQANTARPPCDNWEYTSCKCHRVFAEHQTKEGGASRRGEGRFQRQRGSKYRGAIPGQWSRVSEHRPRPFLSGSCPVRRPEGDGGTGGERRRRRGAPEMPRHTDQWSEAGAGAGISETFTQFGKMCRAVTSISTELPTLNHNLNP